MVKRPPRHDRWDQTRTGEQKLIAEIFAPLAKHPGAFALGDDAARVSLRAGQDQIVTTDTLVEGVHFMAKTPPGLIAQKALRVNLSDLAAKGAKVRAYLLNIAVPGDVNRNWLKKFAAGLAADQDFFGCALIGGDTVRTSGPLVITVTALGTVPKGKMVRRAGAMPGDLVFVSGTMGDGVLGLAEARRDKILAGLTQHHRKMVKHRYLLPQPRVELAPILVRFAHAAMDISDGLAGDLAQLCRASHLTARIDVGDIPFSAAARTWVARNPEHVVRLVTGGDDYEILCAIPPGRAKAFERAAARARVPLTPIGTFVPGVLPPVFARADGHDLAFETMSFSHF